MKVGDLVRPTWQPIHTMNHLGYLEDMEYIIKGRIGIISTVRDKSTYFVYFPEINYTHLLSKDSLEVVCEGR